MAAVIRFGLLGPTAAWRDGRPLDLGTPQQRTLFALLLLQRNQYGVETLAELMALDPLVGHASS